jgi:hypothetical protein
MFSRKESTKLFKWVIFLSLVGRHLTFAAERPRHEMRDQTHDTSPNRSCSVFLYEHNRPNLFATIFTFSSEECARPALDRRMDHLKGSRRSTAAKTVVLDPDILTSTVQALEATHLAQPLLVTRRNNGVLLRNVGMTKQ